MTFSFDWAPNREKFAVALENAKAANNCTSLTVTDAMIIKEYIKLGGQVTIDNGNGTVTAVDNKSTPTLVAKVTAPSTTLKHNGKG